MADCSDANGNTTSPPSVLPVLGGLVECQGGGFKIKYYGHPAGGRGEWFKLDGRSLGAKCSHHGVHVSNASPIPPPASAPGLTLSAKVVMAKVSPTRSYSVQAS